MVVGPRRFGWFFVVPHAAARSRRSSRDTGDYVVTAAPGMGYQYRWDADGDGQSDSERIGDQTSVKVHLDEGKTKTVLVEATSAFGVRRQTAVPLSRPAVVKPIQLGQN